MSTSRKLWLSYSFPFYKFEIHIKFRTLFALFLKHHLALKLSFLHLHHIPMSKLSTNLTMSWQKNKVIHDSWHLISLHGLVAVHLCSPLMHTCALMFKGLVFILSRETPPHITHTELKAHFTNNLPAHIHNFSNGWSVTCQSISKFALQGLAAHTKL